MKKVVQSLYFSLAIKLSSLLKISYIVGSQIAWFSASSVITPLAGAFTGIFGSTFILFVRFFMHAALFKTISLSFLAFCIPGYCASLYFSTSSMLIRAILPLACMILFVVHPVGSHAFVYSFYWLIPVLLYCMQRKTLFLEALGSTFVAHAVGSVIWLYTVPTTVALWLGLLPLVAVERLLFAVAMVVAYKVIVGIKYSVTDIKVALSTLVSVRQ